MQASSETSRNNRWNNYDDLTLKYHNGGLETFAIISTDYGHYSIDQELNQKLHISEDCFDVDASLALRSHWTSVGLSLSYSFNATRSKYKGTGAGNEEKSRL